MHFWVGDRKFAICEQSEHRDGKGSRWLVSTEDLGYDGEYVPVLYTLMAAVLIEI